MHLLNRLILEFGWHGDDMYLTELSLIYFNASCWSSVGNRQEGLQQLSIGANCDKIGTIQHEFMHALGFWHEQSRSDRDDYVSIMWDRIQAGQSLPGFSFQTLVLRGLAVEHPFQPSFGRHTILTPGLSFQSQCSNKISSGICLGQKAPFVVALVIPCAMAVPRDLTRDMSLGMLHVVQQSNKKRVI